MPDNLCLKLSEYIVINIDYYEEIITVNYSDIISKQEIREILGKA